jgi:hypothetical protein
MGEAENVDEDTFWLGDPAAGLRSEAKTQQPDLKSSAVGLSQAAPLPLLYRRRQAQVDVAPVSPSPSHRRPALAMPKVTRKHETHVATDLPSVTPKTRSSTRRALRDSPDNPFLATPEKHVEDTLAKLIAVQILVHMTH